jgi:NADPH:quinone reductase-like Zn-dependent oxidoreductase
MRAIVIDKFGERGSLREMPVPEPAQGQMLVKVATAGVNPIDWKIRDGMRGERKMPMVLGQDFAGTVARAAGPFAEGARIFGIARTYGGDAEYTVALLGAQAEPVAPIPDGVTDVQAAALPTPGLTALAAVEILGVRSGTAILIHGATGGVGCVATQLAHQRGAYVIGTIHGGSADYARSLGADKVIDTTSVDPVAAVKASHSGGIDAVLDLVSMDKEANAKFADVLRPGGKLVTTNHVADEALFKQRGLSAVNVVMNQTPQSSPEGLTELARMVAAGKLKLNIAGERPLADAPSVLDDGKAGKLHGKIVLRVA